nr:tetraprenyl-beta-curcumene synthase family protein [Aquibacillus sediminis]
MYHSIPKTSPILMSYVYSKVFPRVKKELDYWIQQARRIENPELKTQALASITEKKFHCQGGSVYSILAKKRWPDAIRFIVAYQTISDYLDNLCDRSTSLDPKDFRMLHQAMEDALTPNNEVKNYYKYRQEQDDGGYLAALVKTCQNSLSTLEHYSAIQKQLLQLERLYSDLQVHKHVVEQERIPRLKAWFNSFKSQWTMSLHWYEFSASSGSTLGIFCLVSYAMGGKMTEQLAEDICKSYFPYMQGLHILLDYYIDQQEDLNEGDLNFCNYYVNNDQLIERFIYFIDQTKKQIQRLPNKHFHEMIYNGLVGLYLADPKVRRLDSGGKVTKVLLQASGRRSSFFHLNAKAYNKLKGKYRVS